MAERGGQPGNQNASKGRRWSNAIERALEAYPDKPVSLTVNKGIDEAAYDFVAKLRESKDISFFRELGDRLDGKPQQAIDANVDAGAGLLAVLAGLRADE